jgi:apolipoprotein N-acyltransferase
MAALPDAAPSLVRPWHLLTARPLLAAPALGALAATGFAPLGWWPLALAAVAALIALIARSDSPARAALVGWLFGVGHFTLGNNWIATAFTHQAQMPAVLGWIAVPLLALYLAVYPALAALGARALAGRGLSWVLVLALAGCWTLSEMMRATVFTGYAWNPLAMILLGGFDRPGLAALAPFMGTYALSGLSVLLGGVLALLLQARRWFAVAAVAALTLVGMALPAAPSPSRAPGGDGPLAYTLVQPDLPQAQLSDPLHYEANFQRLAGLSGAKAPGTRRLVLWPESGLADYLEPGYPQRYYRQMTAFGDPLLARARLGRVIGEGSVLLTGNVDLELAEGRAIGAYNAVTGFDHRGRSLGRYEKAHLVPYGEYLPMRAVLEPLGLSRLVPGAFDFLPGPGPRTLDLGAHGQAGIQICYEIVFSGEVVDRANRPDYLFNPSNDGWFGAFGPPQHLAQARMRAIEEGLPVLRSTTTGISAVIDPRGVVLQHMPVMAGGRIDGFLPTPLAPPPFARWGNALPLAWALVFLGAAVVAMRRRQR